MTTIVQIDDKSMTFCHITNITKLINSDIVPSQIRIHTEFSTCRLMTSSIIGKITKILKCDNLADSMQVVIGYLKRFSKLYLFTLLF